MIRRLLIALALLMLPVAASAQVTISADRMYLGAAPCLFRTGAGAPTGGRTCEFYLNTDTGDLWQNVNGVWDDVTTYPVVNELVARENVVAPAFASANGTPMILAPGNGTILPSANLGVSFGTPTQKFLTLHLGELWAETLVAQYVMSTIGGRVMIAPTTTLVNDVASTDTSIIVKYNNLNLNDIIYLEAAPNGIPKVEFMRVTSAAAASGNVWIYTVTRNLDGSGANPWYNGDAVVNTGKVGSGSIDLFALTGILTGYGPTIVGNVRTGTAYNAISPRWAIGNLNSIGYGQNTDLYGAAFGNPGGARMSIDDTNGIQMVGPLGAIVAIRPDGTATFAGNGTGVTNINGGNIQTHTVTATQILGHTITAAEIFGGTITTTELNFVPVQNTNVIASINASAEGGGTLVISGNKVSINGFTTFAPGWSPADKISLGGAAADVNANITTINGGQIATHTITAAQIFGGTITTTELNFVPVQNTNVVASINASAEGGGTLRINGNKIVIDGSVTFAQYYDPSGKVEVGGGATDINTHTTQIHGGRIITGSIDAQALNFTAVQSGNVIASINASPEGALRIIGAKITVDGNVTFGTNYDPSGKIAVGGGATDINTNVTTINGGKITTRSISADRIQTQSITANEISTRTITADRIVAGAVTANEMTVGVLSAISTNLGTINGGSMDIGGGTFTVDSSGNMRANSGAIGGCTIVSGEIHCGSSILKSTGMPNINIPTGGFGIIDDNMAGRGVHIVCHTNSGQLLSSQVTGTCSFSPQMLDTLFQDSRLEEMIARAVAAALAARKDQ